MYIGFSFILTKCPNQTQWDMLLVQLAIYLSTPNAKLVRNVTQLQPIRRFWTNEISLRDYPIKCHYKIHIAADLLCYVWLELLYPSLFQINIHL